MFKLFLSLLISFVSLSASAQMLVVDRAPTGATQPLGLSTKTDNFLADDFQVGVAKEDWVIDHIRLWILPDSSTSATALGDIFKQIALYGGIAPDLPPPGPPPVECDCHNLPPLKTAALQPGSDATGTPEVVITKQPDGVWQLDFTELKWSLPGGTPIQFAVVAAPRAGINPSSGHLWYYSAQPAAPGDHLRIFSSVGKVQGPYPEGGNARVNVQVWAHLLARISIRPAGQKLKVVLWSEPLFETAQVDTTTLRFGPSNASPDSAPGAAPDSPRTEDVAEQGKSGVAAFFRPSESGLGPRSVNACLTGKRTDGAPFEACDLLPKPKADPAGK